MYSVAETTLYILALEKQFSKTLSENLLILLKFFSPHIHIMLHRTG